MPLEYPYNLLLYIWLGVMVLLITFLVAIAVRTGRFKPRETPRPRRPAYSPDQAKLAAESLSEAIAFRTISYAEGALRDYNQFVGLRRYLRTRYPLCHARLEFEQVGGFSLLFCWRTPRPQSGPIMLCGHLDVVPAAEGWEISPFEGLIREGYVYGRGALDCKSNVICIFEALESLLAEGLQPNRDVYLAFGHDQELGGRDGARQIARLLSSRGVAFDFILDEGNPISDSILPIGCPVAEIGVSEKGNLNLRITAKDEGGHAGHPPAHTSLGVLSEALCRMEFKPHRPRLTPLVKDTLLALAPYLPYKHRMYIANTALFRKKLLKLLTAELRSAALVRTTVTPVMAQSGHAPHMLPGLSEAILNIALLSGDTEKTLLNWLEVLNTDLGIEAEVLLGTPPGRISDYHCPVYRELVSAIDDVFQGIPVVPALSCMMTDARYYEPLSNAVYRFSPFILPPDDIKGIHGKQEKVAEVSLGAAVRFYRRLLERLCQFTPDENFRPIEDTPETGSAPESAQEQEETL